MIRTRPEFAALLIVCTLFLIAYATIVPVFEKPDENAHWTYAVYVAQNHRRPLDVNRTGAEWSENYLERFQPPLFYVVAATVFGSGLDPVGTFSFPVRNPAFGYGPFREPNRYLHPLRPGALSDTGGAFLTLRLFCAFLGLATIAIVYRCGDLFFSGSRPLAFATGAVVGLLPQFLFITSSVSNDALATLFAAISLYIILVWLAVTDTRVWIPLALGAVVGLGCLTKTTDLVLVPVALAAVIWKSRQPAGRAGHIAAFLLAFGVIYLPYPAWNTIRLDDPLLLRLGNADSYFAVHAKSLTSSYWLCTFFPTLGMTFLGTFGWLGLYLPDQIYQIATSAAAGSFVGLLDAIRRCVVNRNWSWPGAVRHGVLLGMTLAALGATVGFNLTYGAPWGRYLFPVIGALSLLFIGGWANLVGRLSTKISPSWLAPPGLGPGLAAVLAVALILVNLYVLLALIGIYSPGSISSWVVSRLPTLVLRNATYCPG